MNEQSARPAFVGVAVSHASDPVAAADDAAAAIDISETCFILAFIPDHLVSPEFAEALEARLGGVPIFGCTTAGQISGRGYETDALVLLAFPKRHFRCASMLVTPLQPLSIKTIAADARRHSEKFLRTHGWNRLALLMVDGLAKQEDVLVSTLETVLGDIPVFGGSAADGLSFSQTFVLHGGQFHTDAALLLILETDLAFTGLGFDHFLPSDQQLVVTEALPEDRLVLEINGAPAAPEYARLIGREVDALTPEVFAENPLLVRQNMAYHVRAIHAVQESDALSFLSAIDDGLLMTLGRGKEILETLEAGLSVTGPEGERPDFILGFDCVLRRLEIEQKGLKDAVSDIFRRHRVLGFNTYGEQHCGVHVNQTFVGVAFFGPGRKLLP
ncbi:FIST N-terminal domain-containing protein [Litorisediminicola beolgyonensis]|uniref:FIST N-terminal domain-containing protein n=1 Tax=Litorisediminicola beolgyonensis TaxID=1173614 RepID=A0ABW3ZNV0_9RHOB